MKAAYRRVIISAVVCQTLLACTHIPGASSSEDGPKRLWFANETPEHVTVYLAVNETRPMRLGDVDGFRARSLPWPHLAAGNRGRILVVPIGTSLAGRASLADLDGRGWSTPAEPTQNIVALRWTLVGHSLYSAPLTPQGR
jgi:hypothetical protein